MNRLGLIEENRYTTIDLKMRLDKILDDIKISGAFHSSEIRSFKCYSLSTV